MLETVPHLPQLLDAKFPGRALAGLIKLKGDASTRSYYRAQFAESAPEPASLIVMRLPDEPPDGASRVQAQAFLDVQQFFAANRLPVPQIYAEDVAHGLMLLEDLGDDTFEARLRRTPTEDWPARYGDAIDLLARMHDVAARAPDPSACIALRKRFDAALLRWELDHFREWGLEALFGVLPAPDRVLLDAHFDALIASIMRLPQGFVHRDYQSRNLMWACERLVIIDFQDAFIGPAPYDLVALLCDSYVALSADMQDAMLLRYAEQRDYTAAQLEGLVRGFRLIAVQRKLKDAGRFVFLDRVRNNPSFLPYYPGSLEYVGRALGQLQELAPLRELLLRLVPEMPA